MPAAFQLLLVVTQLVEMSYGGAKYGERVVTFELRDVAEKGTLCAECLAMEQSNPAASGIALVFDDRGEIGERVNFLCDRHFEAAQQFILTLLACLRGPRPFTNHPSLCCANTFDRFLLLISCSVASPYMPPQGNLMERADYSTHLYKVLKEQQQNAFQDDSAQCRWVVDFDGEIIILPTAVLPVIAKTVMPAPFGSIAQ